MNSYHFDIGNSSTGPLGFCARVTAYSKEEAVEVLRNRFSRDICEHEIGKQGIRSGDYCCVYFNADAITVNDIDDWESEDE